MTAREQQITKAALDCLHDLDGGQFTELQWHGATNLHLHAKGLPESKLAEFSQVMTICDTRRWVRAVQSGVTKAFKYNLTDLGEAARLEM